MLKSSKMYVHLENIINNNMVLHAAYSIRREIEIYTGKKHYPLLYQNKWRTIYIIHSADFITFSREGSSHGHWGVRCGITGEREPGTYTIVHSDGRLIFLYQLYLEIKTLAFWGLRLENSNITNKTKYVKSLDIQIK